MTGISSLIHFTIAMPFYNKGVKWLKVSARKHAIETKIISSWLKIPNLEKKITYQYKFVSKLEDRDIVLFTDSYDVLIVKDKNIILEAFHRLNSTAVFSAEKICWPDYHKESFFSGCNSPWRYLNSGGWIGVAKNMKEILSTAMELYNSSKKKSGTDQRIYTDIYLSNLYMIKLDTNCNIFQSLWGSEDDIIFNNGEWINKVTNTTPCIMHANGNIKNILPIARSFGYNFKV